MFSEAHAIWLGGIFDGEGSARIYHSKSHNTFWAVAQPLSNTDPDIVQRGLNYLYLLEVDFTLRPNNGNTKRKGSKPWWKPCADIRMGSYPAVSKYLTTILPHITGNRRRQAIAVLDFVNVRMKRINPGKRGRPVEWQTEDEKHYRNQPVSRGREIPTNT